ncbi:rust resistance kinase Lr10-like [Gastrolobium bilobum]|uniref:rust resistance kinase Lr10-like n=1 Tax=Gastrolobium bilobum TaxID=150636 RepID=UPI002AB27349|nr:rust resistance kinase Lr10-like [Gastrolobium bilobum]
MTILALLLLLLMNVGNAKNGPSIACPIRVSCTENRKTLELPAVPVPVKLVVSRIDYRLQTLEAYDPENCLPELLLRLNDSSFLPFFKFTGSFNISFFNCSSVKQRHPRYGNLTQDYAQDLLSCPIYVAYADESIIELDLISCTKLSDHVLPFLESEIMRNSISLVWTETNFDDGCFECTHKSKNPTSFVLTAAGVIAGSTVLALVLSAFFRLYCYFRMKGEDHVRVENFLKDYRALKPTRFSYADIKRITHQFKDKLGEGAHGAVYKGKLSSQILVAVKTLNSTEGDGKEFINEVGTMGKIHHVNVVRLLGFCADGSHRALVYDFFPNGSLQNFISPQNSKDTFLGWDKLQQIAVGIAKGIEYLHQGCDHRILHFDINPHNVLLDDSFIPKITDFGLAKLCSKNRSTVSMTAARGTLGYMAPEVFSRNFGSVSYKSDMYSYGMLLLEMVGGRKNVNTVQDTFQVLYPDWIHSLLEGVDVNIPIDEEGDFRIAKKLAIVGLWCIQWHPVQRPSMKTVMQMLQGEGDKLQVPPSPFESTASTNSSANITTRPLNLELEVIQELD